MLKVHDANFNCSAVYVDQYPEYDKKEIILLGRSNVGKSTFINKFCKRKKLAYTSSKPGKTQTLNFFNINDDLAFVDVPGYGYAKVSKKQREEFGVMIETFLTNRPNLKQAILLLDFKVGPTNDDILMYEFLKYHKIPVFLIGTKKDKVKKSQFSKQSKLILEKLILGPTDFFYAYSCDSDEDMLAICKKLSEILGYEEKLNQVV